MSQQSNTGSEEVMVEVRVLCMGLMAAVGVASLGSADTLAVTHAAAMGGTTWGLQVFHDNTSAVYVQDDTPTGEKTYRANFLIQVGTVSFAGPSANFRQSLLRGIGPNPNPGAPPCSSDPGFMYAMVQLWLYQTGGGQVSNLQLWGKGNLCGDQGTVRIPLSNNQPYRVCLEYQTGASSTGFVALAVTSPASACPASGNPAWVSVNFSNHLTSIDLVRLGTPATNAFGAQETVTIYFDEFRSEGEDASHDPMAFVDGFEWGDTSGWGPPSSSCVTSLSPDPGITGAR